MHSMHPRKRDKVLVWVLLLLLVNIAITGSLLYAIVHLQPTIIVDTVSFLDKLWPF
jgi:cytochrome b subunit of formate dehydrogenase